MQVLRMMNLLLDKHPQSRRRGLSFNTLTIIPVWPQVASELHSCLSGLSLPACK